MPTPFTDPGPSLPGPASAQPAPAGAAAFTRRTVLQVGGIASLAGLLGGLPALGLDGLPHAYAADPTPTPTTPGTVPPPPRPTPYTIQASCELSEDYFLTDQVVVDGNDRVLPFTTPDGTVEAVVLAGGAVSHLRRDPAQTSGWAFTTISATVSVFAQGPITDAAVQTDSDGFTVLACVQSVDDGPALRFYTVDSAGNWSSIPDTTFTLAEAPTNQLKTQSAPNGLIYFYLFGDDGVFDVYVVSDAGSGLDRLPIDSLQGISVADAILLWNPDQQPNQPPNGSAAIILDSNGNLNSYPQTDLDDFNPNSPTELAPQHGGSVADLIWAAAKQGQTQPDVVFQTSDGALYYSDSDGDSVAVAVDYGDTPGPGRAAVWRDEDLYSFAFLDTSGLVNILAQYHDTPTSTQFTDPIPLQGGIHAIYGQPSDPTQATLFVVDVDLTLNILAKDTTGAWSYLPVHQDGATLQEVTSWRVQLLVQDANTTPIGGAQVRLGADQTIGCWQSTGNTMLSSAPVTLTADPTGRITFSIPTSELDTATLTAQALDANGQPTGGPTSIDPDTDAHHFLAGGSSLTDIGMLSSTALLGAQNADGTPLLPGLTNLPSGQMQAAQAVVGALQHTAALGLGSTPQSATDPRSAILDFTGNSGPTFQTSTDPNAYISLMAVEGISDWWDKAKNDAESVYHAIRHAAATVTKMVTTWSDDAKKWTVNLFVDLGDGVQNLMNYVVNTMHDAIHAISGFFHSLGSDIVKTWQWLKHHVLELIKDADANAKVLQSWFTPFFTSLTNVIDTIEIDVDTFFTNLEAQASTQIAALAAVVEDLAFGSSAPLPPATPDTGSRDADLAFKAGQDVITFMRHTQANWLLDKLRAHLPQAPTDGGPDFSDFDADLEKVIQDLFADIADSINLIESINTTLWDAVKPFLTDFKTFSETSMGAFFTALQSTVDDALKLINDVLTTLLDAVKAAVAGIKDLLSYQFQAVPVIGDLLELAGVDTTLSIERIVSLIAAYPTTLINNIIGGGPLFPPDNTPPGVNGAVPSKGTPPPPVGSERVDGWAVGLNWMSAIVQAVWSTNDMFLDDGAAAKGFKGNALTTSLDIICPVVINMLQWPSPPTDAGLTQPFWAGINGKGSGTDLIPWMLFTAFIPPAAGIFYVVGDANGFADAPDYNDYGVPIFCAIAGVANTVLSSIYGQDQSVGAASISFGVLSNVSYDVAPLGFPALNEAFDDTPAIAKLIIDLIANFGTAVAMSSQAIAAAIKPLTDRIPL